MLIACGAVGVIAPMLVTGQPASTHNGAELRPARRVMNENGFDWDCYCATFILATGCRGLVQGKRHASGDAEKVEFALKSPHLQICRVFLVQERQTKGSSAG